MGSAAGDFTSRATGTVPDRAPAIAASEASTRTGDPSVVTMIGARHNSPPPSAE
ncbi:hypothetical protein ACTPOK_32510 [Streptomyces inhibens]|uniref:hypothetical protein n=1 Tax=Streptomyces inhibens TaxID=2293571 RepID=UPI00402AF8F2